MYIDVHTHLAFSKIYPPAYLSGMIGNRFLSPDKRIEEIFGLLLNDSVGTKIIREMDGANISKSVVLVSDGGLGIEEPKLSIEEIHELHFKCLRLYPDRLIMFAGIDPRRGPNGFQLFRNCIEEYGFKGLKLYPPMGYAMDDDALHQYYNICEERRLCVLIHTGPSLSSLQNDFAEVKFIKSIAKRYQNINFILAHAGNRLLDSDVREVLLIPNVYADIAGFQQLPQYANSSKGNPLCEIFKEEFNRKILFGSYWPLFSIMSPLKTHIDNIRLLFKMLDTVPEINLENVLFRNANRVLGPTA